jgi:hypothetical protein
MPLWALAYISDGDDDRIEQVVHTIPILITLLESTESMITLPALRTLGNIVTGSERQTQMVIDGGLLQHALKILEHPKVCTHYVQTISRFSNLF